MWGVTPAVRCVSSVCISAHFTADIVVVLDPSSEMPHPQDWFIASRKGVDVEVSARTRDHQVVRGATLFAHTGVNTFLITHSALVGAWYPDHITNATFGGRLISETVVVNVEVELEYDRVARGYVATFDIRDPGVYTLQVWLLWYFGRGDRHLSPEPIAVGRPGQYLSSCGFRRSLISGGLPLRVELTGDGQSTELPRFGDRTCQRVTSGRWISLLGPCLPPYCVGNLDALFSLPDTVGWGPVTKDFEELSWLRSFVMNCCRMATLPVGGCGSRMTAT